MMEAALTAMIAKMTARVGRSSNATASAIWSHAATRNPMPSPVDPPKCDGANARWTAPAPRSNAATSHCTHPMPVVRAAGFGGRGGDDVSVRDVTSGGSSVMAMMKRLPRCTSTPVGDARPGHSLAFWGACRATRVGLAGWHRRDEAEQLLRVAALDLVLRVRRQAGQQLLGHADAVGPRGVAVRVVRLEHHVVLTDDVERAQTR